MPTPQPKLYGRFRGSAFGESPSPQRAVPGRRPAFESGQKPMPKLRNELPETSRSAISLRKVLVDNRLFAPIPELPGTASTFASNDDIIDANIWSHAMRTTVTLDEALLAKASKLTGPLDRSALLHEGLKALIERESAKRLAKLGGSQPNLKAAPRRRQEPHT